MRVWACNVLPLSGVAGTQETLFKQDYGGHIGVIQQAHRHVHDGTMFHASVRAAVGGVGEYARIAINPPTTHHVHLLANSDCSEVAEFKLLSGVTLTGGATVTPEGLNQSSSNTSSIAAGNVKTGATGGTALTYTGGSELSGHYLTSGRRAGGIDSWGHEWVLEESVWTVLELVSLTSQANYLNMLLYWYETPSS